MDRNNRIENMLMMSGNFRLDPNFIMQMIIIGDYSVGKTTALRHMARDKCKQPLEVYCPMSVRTQMTRHGRDVKLKIIDTGGKIYLLLLPSHFGHVPTNNFSLTK